MLALDAEKVKKTGDIAMLLFSRQDSRKAAQAFVDWLKGKKGRCTKSSATWVQVLVCALVYLNMVNNAPGVVWL